MPLPILRAIHEPSTDTLLRYFHAAQHAWVRHLTEDETRLDVGVAMASAERGKVGPANRMVDASLPLGMTPADAIGLVNAHYATRACRCQQWVLNPSAPIEQTRPLEDYFRSAGFHMHQTDVLVRIEPKFPTLGSSTPGSSAHPSPGDSIRVIPARASYRHAEAIHRQMIEPHAGAAILEASMAHLDDPHVDALLALHDGQAVAHAAVLSMGEVGMIEQLFVIESARRRGLGTTMLARALEVCARSVFKHVLAGSDPSDTPRARMFDRFGFKRAGELKVWNAPATTGASLSTLPC